MTVMDSYISRNDRRDNDNKNSNNDNNNNKNKNGNDDNHDRSCGRVKKQGTTHVGGQVQECKRWIDQSIYSSLTSCNATKNKP